MFDISQISYAGCGNEAPDMRKSDAVAPLRNQKHIEARLRPFLRFILLQIAISYFMVLLRW